MCMCGKNDTEILSTYPDRARTGASSWFLWLIRELKEIHWSKEMERYIRRIPGTLMNEYESVKVTGKKRFWEK